jgi:hypothetical protein
VGDADMLNVDVSLRKEDYGEPNTSDYRKNMLIATTSLTEKFGVAKHKLVTRAQDGDQEKSAHIFSMWLLASCIVLKKDRREVRLWTGWIFVPCPASVEVWIVKIRVIGGMALRLMFGETGIFARRSRSVGGSLVLTSTFLKGTELQASGCNSLCTTLALILYNNELSANQRGGVIYLFYVLHKMFEMSREVKDAMQKFLDIFKHNGVSRYSG